MIPNEGFSVRDFYSIFAMKLNQTRLANDDNENQNENELNEASTFLAKTVPNV